MSLDGPTREETDDDEDTHYIYRPRDASVAPREVVDPYFPRVAYDRDDRRCGSASALIDAMCCDYSTTSRLFDEVRDDDDAFFASKAFPNGFETISFHFREESSSSSGALREERTLRHMCCCCVFAPNLLARVVK